MHGFVINLKLNKFSEHVHSMSVKDIYLINLIHFIVTRGRIIQMHLKARYVL